VCVKFRKNWSIRSRITAFFRNPIWRSAAILDSPLCKFRGKPQHRSCLLVVCVKFRENWSIRSRVTAFFRNPIWRSAAILDSHYANFEVNFSTGVAFWLCVSNFVKIGRSVPELRHFFEIQYGGRSPSWIPEMYAFCQLALNRMPSYANVENFMPIGLPVQKLERFYYCGVLAKNSLCRVVFWGFLGFPEHKRNCWTF
jgi:hypothetical protein